MTDDVRAALRALAADDGTTSHAAVVDDATAALDDLDTAAAFVDGGGLDRLRRAIDRADRAGDHAVADQGREALTTIERCRRAAADYFRSGRGTVLSGDDQRSGR